jgi:hypothetical protein
MHNAIAYTYCIYCCYLYCCYRYTEGYPKALKLLVAVLDSSKYEITDGAIYITPNKLLMQRELASATYGK